MLFSFDPAFKYLLNVIPGLGALEEYVSITVQSLVGSQLAPEAMIRAECYFLALVQFSKFIFFKLTLSKTAPCNLALS